MADVVPKWHEVLLYQVFGSEQRLAGGINDPGNMERKLDLEHTKDTIQKTIAPYVGANMARASTQAHCERLGLEGESITPEELKSLLDRLAKAMRVFVGPQTTNDVVRTIEREVLGKGST